MPENYFNIVLLLLKISGGFAVAMAAKRLASPKEVDA